MDEQNENIEPVTDLGLSLGHSNHNIQRRLNNDFGAGANAASRIDMTFVASDPLSELVWSPQNGLSLKCAECSFSEKKPSHLWGAGPSNIIPAPLIIKAGRCSDDKLVDETFTTSLSHKNTRVGVDTLGKSPRYTASFRPMGQSDHEQADKDNSLPGTGCFVDEMNTKGAISVRHPNEMNDLEESKGGNTSDEDEHQATEIAGDIENNLLQLPDVDNQDVAQIVPLFNDPVGGGNQMSGTEVFLAPEVHAGNKCVAFEPPEQNLISSNRKHEKSDSFMGKVSEPEVRKESSPCLFPSEKLEAIAENDFPTPISRNVCGTTCKIAESQSPCEVTTTFERDEKTLQKQTSSGEHSPNKRKIHKYQRKGKKKALSDGDVMGRMSEEEDDSHESVESCNSTGLFFSGKRQWGFDQQLIFESKRVKKQIHGSPGSSSFNKQDSSFMNWISNTMKGFLKSKAETPSLALTVAHPNHGHDSPGKVLEICDKNPRNFGFQSMFQSIYCPKKKVQGTITLDKNPTRFEPANTTFDMDATLIACHGENIDFHKMLLLQNEGFKESTAGDVAGPATELKISSVNFSAYQRNSEGSSAVNKNSCKLVAGAEKDGRSSSSSLGKHKVMNTENIDSDPAPESKRVHNISYKSDPLGSSWIARLTPKASSPLLNQDNHNQSASGAIECSNDSMMLIPYTENRVSVSNDLKVAEVEEAWQQCGKEPVIVSCKELQNCTTETEVSIGFNRITVQNDQKSACKLNPILLSTRFKNSDAMTSLFARRLDALKHIIPAGVSEDGAPAMITCFFCGTKGHHLKDCSELTDTELEELVRTVESHKGVEELPCVCIRCFRINHWAIACPTASSRGQRQSVFGDFLANDSKMQCNKRNEEIPESLNGNENQKAAVSCTVFDGTKTQMGTHLDYVTTADKMRSSMNLNKKYEASSSRTNELKENQITPLFDFISQQVSYVRKGIFDAIKMLRLSRTDVLKWMNSQMSLLHLDGFFLRLRLGKGEEVLGSTGYYVARISGAQRLNSQRNSKSSIWVNVGGIKCMVESKYISNHDFLEDELMAWWHATTRSGGKIPSEEELKIKVQGRRMLGL